LPNTDLFKKVVIAIARLGKGEVAAVRVVGLSAGNDEEAALVRTLIEDHRPFLEPDVVIRRLDAGDCIELRRTDAQGDVIEFDIGGGAPA